MALPFKYVGGDPSVDFINTVDWTARGPERDRLDSFSRLLAWATDAALLSDPDRRRLDELAAEASDGGAAALRYALDVRARLKRLYASIVDAREDVAAWSAFNEVLAAAQGAMSVAQTADQTSPAAVAEWCWSGSDAPLDTIVLRVLWAAAELLTGADGHRLRLCDGPDCGWMLVDRSRNGLRRWCEMETCGTAAKTRRRRVREGRRR